MHLKSNTFNGELRLQNGDDKPCGRVIRFALGEKGCQSGAAMSDVDRKVCVCSV